ncbi:MAG: CHAD domain-containing protein [Xanthomonadales bacterium]|nr:CHAD domain-containing protein [Xanthomonadales bacterium]
MAFTPNPKHAAAPQFYQLMIRESEAIDRHLRQLEQGPSEPILNTETHIEELHQLRVRTRRLHTLMNQLGKHLPNKLRQLQSSYRKHIKATNVLRDLDVLEQRLSLWSQEGDNSIRHACHYLRWQAENKRLKPASKKPNTALDILAWMPEQVLHQAQEQAPDYQAQLGEAWFSSFYQLNNKLRKRLKQQLKQKAEKPVLSKLISRRIAQLQDDIQHEFQAWNDGNAQAAHDLRISIKQLRYLLQPWREIDGCIAPVLHVLKPLQEALGLYHDNHIQQLWLAQQTPLIAQRYYQQCSELIQHQSGISRYALQRQRPSPMNGLISIAIDLQYQQRMMESWLQETLNDAMQTVLFGSLSVLSLQLRTTPTNPKPTTTNTSN